MITPTDRSTEYKTRLDRIELICQIPTQFAVGGLPFVPKERFPDLTVNFAASEGLQYRLNLSLEADLLLPTSSIIYPSTNSQLHVGDIVRIRLNYSPPTQKYET